MSELKAFVHYKQPGYPELRASFDRVWEEYDGLLFVPTDACVHVPQTPREVAFELYMLGDDTVNEEILAELRSDNLRPAIYQEAIAITAKHPDLQLGRPFVVFGSTAMPKVEADDPVVRAEADGGFIDVSTGRVRSFASFDRSGPETKLGLLFDVGFLDEGTTILAVRE